MKHLAQIPGMQRGAAALATSAILLLAVTLVVIYAGKVLVMDQRMSGNDYRYDKAMANAEAGLGNRSAFLMYNGANGIPFGTAFNQINTVPYFSATMTQTASWISIISEGYAYGADLTQGRAMVREGFGQYRLFGRGPFAPLTVAGSVPPTGNMEIVGNPNAGGPGVNVSVWTNQTPDISGSPATCKYAEYYGNAKTSSPVVVTAQGMTTCSANSCQCGGQSGGKIDGRISYANHQGRDIVVDSAANFPNDVFLYVTGIAHADYKSYRANPKIKKLTPNQCSTLGPSSNGIYWIAPSNFLDPPSNVDTSTTCDLPNSDVGGAAGNNCGKTADKICAVVLFMENVRVKNSGGDIKVFGVIFSFDRTTKILANGTIQDATDSDDEGVQMAGSTALYGAMMSDSGLVVSSLTGSFDLVYNAMVLDELSNDSKNQNIARIAGSWIDP